MGALVGWGGIYWFGEFGELILICCVEIGKLGGDRFQICKFRKFSALVLISWLRIYWLGCSKFDRVGGGIYRFGCSEFG